MSRLVLVAASVWGCVLAFFAFGRDSCGRDNISNGQQYTCRGLQAPPPGYQTSKVKKSKEE